MTNNVGNLGVYREDISSFFRQMPGAAVHTVGFLGKRAVMLLQDTSKIIKTPEALKETMRGVIAIATILGLYVSDKVLKLALTFQSAVAAWKIGLSVQYFVEGKFVADFKQAKLASIVAETFFCIGRIAVTGAWFIKQELMTVATAASLVGSIPMFGAAILALETSLVINALFFTGISFMFVDRLRAALKGGYASAAVEQEKARKVQSDIAKTLVDPSTGARFIGPLNSAHIQEIERAVAEKKNNNQWCAWADVVNLFAEGASIALTFTPFVSHCMAVVAAASNIAGCVWDKEPQNRLRVVSDADRVARLEIQQ